MSNKVQQSRVISKARVKRLVRGALGAATAGTLAVVIAMPVQAADFTVTNQTEFTDAVADSQDNNQADNINIGDAVGTLDISSSVSLPGEDEPVTVNIGSSNTLNVGTSAGTGSLVLEDGAQINVNAVAASHVRIGNASTGSMTINDGSSVVFNAVNGGSGNAGGFTVGRTDGGVIGNGTLNINGGTLELNEAADGNSFVQLIVGWGEGATGTINQNGGELNMGFGTSNIGYNGATGTYNLTNDAQAVFHSNFFVGRGTDSVGTVNVHDSASISFFVNGGDANFNLGTGSGAVGTFNQDGPDSVVSINMQWNTFGDSGGAGTYNLSDGELVLGGLNGIWLGNNGGTGIINQSGGVLDTQTNYIPDGEFGFRAGKLHVGYGANSYGEYNLSGGESIMNYGLVIAQSAGSEGEVNQTGGILRLNNSKLHFGDGTATYNLNGGVLEIDNDGSDPFTHGTGTHAFNLGGGTIQAQNDFTTDVDFNLVEDTTSTFDTQEHTVTYTGAALNEAGTLGKAGVGTLVLQNGITGLGGLRVGEGTVQSNASVSGIDRIYTGHYGQLNVAGNLTLDSDSVYEVETDDNGAAGLIDVLGTAYLNGSSVQLSNSSTYSVGQQFDILQADTVDGQFAEEVITNHLYLTPTLSYTDDVRDTVTLTIERNENSFDTFGDTRNQRNAAAAVEELGEGNELYDAVLNLGTQAQAREAFTQLSGEVHGAVPGILMQGSHFLRDALGRQMAAWNAEESNPQFARLASISPLPAIDIAGEPRKSQVWAQGYGNWGRINGEGGTARVNTSTGGVVVGYDTQVSSKWRAGIAGGIDSTSFDLSGQRSSGRSKGTHLAAFAGTQRGAVRVRLGAAYSWNDINTTRRVDIPVTDRLRADYDASTSQLFGEVGLRRDRGNLTLEPFVGLAHVKVKADRFSERGGPAALSGKAESESSTFATLGVRFETANDTSQRSGVSFHGMLGWRHAFSSIHSGASVSFAGGNNFHVDGAPAAENSVLAQLGVAYRLRENASIGLTYSGQFGGSARANALEGSVNVAF